MLLLFVYVIYACVTSPFAVRLEWRHFDDIVLSYAKVI